MFNMTQKVGLEMEVLKEKNPDLVRALINIGISLASHGIDFIATNELLDEAIDACDTMMDVKQKIHDANVELVSKM